ncbi:MAG TPA: MFS transporter, partial [Acetobacteraceae bacterium]
MRRTSKTHSHPDSQPGETADAPDTPRGWLMVAAAFVVGFVVFGLLYSFGVFLGPIVADFHASRAAASALFSATGLGFYLAGPVTGHLGDRFGPRIMAGAGAVLMGA